MKLVVFGLAISSSWGNGHATLWRGLCRALADRGHLVVFFERDVPYYASHRDLWTLPDGRLHLYSSWEAIQPVAGRELSDADAGIVTSFCPDALAAERLLADAPRARKVFYDLDTAVTLDRLDRGEGVEYIGPNGLAGYDLVLSYTGGRSLQRLQQRLGARRTAPLYGSVDPDAHQPAAPIALFRADLSYLGTYADDRQDGVERLFLEPARRSPGRRFVLGGSQYPADFPWTPNLFYMRHVAPEYHPAFYSSSRLTLNVTRRAMADTGFCPSGRLFEAAACGAPILSDNWEGLDAFFTPGEEILVAHDTDDTVAALDCGDDQLARHGAGGARADADRAHGGPTRTRTRTVAGGRHTCGESFRRRARARGFSRWPSRRSCYRSGAGSTARLSGRARSASISSSACSPRVRTGSRSSSRRASRTSSSTTAARSAGLASAISCSANRPGCATRSSRPPHSSARTSRSSSGCQTRSGFHRRTVRPWQRGTVLPAVSSGASGTVRRGGHRQARVSDRDPGEAAAARFALGVGRVPHAGACAA